ASSVFNGIKSVITPVWESIKSVLKSIKAPIDSVVGFFQGLWNSIKRVMDNIVGKIKGAWDKAGGILDKLNPFRSIDVDVNVDNPEETEGPQPRSGVLGGSIG
ncbi:hypothetical protein COK29_29715, partial [Bacillus cereus]